MTAGVFSPLNHSTTPHFRQPKIPLHPFRLWATRSGLIFEGPCVLFLTHILRLWAVSAFCLSCVFFQPVVMFCVWKNPTLSLSLSLLSHSQHYGINFTSVLSHFGTFSKDSAMKSLFRFFSKIGTELKQLERNEISSLDLSSKKLSDKECIKIANALKVAFECHLFFFTSQIQSWKWPTTCCHRMLILWMCFDPS